MTYFLTGHKFVQLNTNFTTIFVIEIQINKKWTAHTHTHKKPIIVSVSSGTIMVSEFFFLSNIITIYIWIYDAKQKKIILNHAYHTYINNGQHSVWILKIFFFVYNFFFIHSRYYIDCIGKISKNDNSFYQNIRKKNIIMIYMR